MALATGLVAPHGSLFSYQWACGRQEKRSSYAPKEDEAPVRYDGIYRIRRCWRSKGAQGYLVCRYLFVRCDNAPAPWSSEGPHRSDPMHGYNCGVLRYCLLSYTDRRPALSWP